MIHYQDEQSLLRILRLPEVPADVLAECECRTAMFHGDGHSGPMGTLALIDMVRFMGYKLDVRPEKPKSVDWHKLPTNGSVKVQAKFMGNLEPGIFLGFVQNGTLAVRLLCDPMVREFPKDLVQPLEVDTETESEKRDREADAPPPSAELLDKPTDTVSPTDGGAAKAEVTDWAKVKKETAVWVQDSDGDLKDGVFVSVTNGGLLLVKLDGEKDKREVQSELVALAG